MKKIKFYYPNPKFTVEHYSRMAMFGGSWGDFSYSGSDCSGWKLTIPSSFSCGVSIRESTSSISVRGTSNHYKGETK